MMWELYTDKYLETCAISSRLEIRRVGPSGFNPTNKTGIDEHQWRFVDLKASADEQAPPPPELATLHVSWSFRQPPIGVQHVVLNYDISGEAMLRTTLRNAVLLRRLAQKDGEGE